MAASCPTLSSCAYSGSHLRTETGLIPSCERNLKRIALVFGGDPWAMRSSLCAGTAQRGAVSALLIPPRAASPARGAGAASRPDSGLHSPVARRGADHQGPARQRLAACRLSRCPSTPRLPKRGPIYQRSHRLTARSTSRRLHASAKYSTTRRLQRNYYIATAFCPCEGSREKGRDGENLALRGCGIDLVGGKVASD